MSIVSSFNTSHVVVYLIKALNDIKAAWFQYISCCSLSFYNFKIFRLTTVSIHLMLQFIFLVNASSFLSSFVSIHLMLQFIPVVRREVDEVPVFQYISCCSLSNIFICVNIFSNSFNTSHVVVYQFLTLEAGISPDGFNTSHVVVYHYRL